MDEAAPRVPMDLVLCWHMHQPDYRQQGRLLKPWTWLHALKDYSDMAAHLEDIPGARAVVNFSPVLILQLQDLPPRIHALLNHDQPSGDAILDALAGRLPRGPEREDLVRALLRVNEATMKDRIPTYARDYERASACLAEGRPLPEANLLSLLTGYVLAWLGESLRPAALPARLAAQAGDVSAADRRALLQWLAEAIAGLLPRYRALADEGRIELSVTPWSHPILPLLLNHETAREAMPEVTLPGLAYPGGAERCEWQIGEAVRLFEEVFGRRPAGCWPAEGGISEAVVHLLGRHGFRWTASGAQVLFNSLGERAGAPQLQPWMLKDANTEDSPTVFFRDDELSDRIGFEYARWPAEDAVEDLLARILQRRQEWERMNPGEGSPVLAIIMDGENAWEYYPENGQAFLRGLYRRLSGHPELNLTTFSEAADAQPAPSLSRLVAGSWVHGNFSTWIGDPAKNRAWDLLARAKLAVDAALAPVWPEDGSPPPGWVQDILRQLAVCEASDWFWWLGPDNRLQDGPAFDRLYRRQLAELYALLGTVPPAELEQPLDDYGYLPEDAPSAQAGTMRQATE